MYIWQQQDWSRFHWQEERIKPHLDAVRLLQCRLLGRTEVAPEHTGRVNTCEFQ